MADGARLTRPGDRWGVLQGLGAVLVLLGSVVAIVPISPDYPAAALDSAWMFAINAAVARHLHFGRDVVFTFGPYGSVYTHSYMPDTDRLSLAASTVLALAMAAGLVVLTRERGRWLAVLTAVLLSRLAPRDPLFFMTALLFIAVVAAFLRWPAQPSRPLAAAAVLLLAALALLPVIKGTFTAAVVVALGLSGLLIVHRGRKALVIAMAAGFAAALLVAWCLAGQRLVDLPAFFAAQSEIVRGYTEAMAIEGPVWQVALFGVISCLLLALHWGAARRGGLPSWIVLVGTAALLGLSYKASFVRQDAHIAIAGGFLGLTGCVLAIWHRGPGPMVGMAAGLIGWAILNHAVDHCAPDEAFTRLATVYRRAGRDLLVRIEDGQVLRSRYDDALGAIRAAYPLPALAGTTDIYSIGQSILLANGLDWSPRPVLQSYSAYTTWLEEADARHLTGPAAPENVVIKLEPIDERLPSLEDGASWPPLLDRYEAVALAHDMAIFHLSPSAQPHDAFGVSSRAVRQLGETIAVPPGLDPVWAKVDVRPTALGRLAGAVFRAPPVRIVIKLAGDRTRSFAFVPEMGRAGFIVAPLVGSTLQLVAMQTTGPGVFADADVTSFAIEADGRFWRRAVPVELAPLHVEPRPGAASVLFAKPRPVLIDGSSTARCNADLLDGRLIDAARPVTAHGGIRLTGWGFVSDGVDEEADTMTVALESADGSAVGVPAMIEPRPDVGLYFHRPGLSQVGFEALLDTGLLNGPQRFMLLMSKGGHHWSCPLIDHADVVADDGGKPACRKAAPAGRCG